MTAAPARALALTPKAWDLLAGTPPPTKGICGGCGQLAYVWDGKVTCVDRSGPKYGRHCDGDGKPPRAET